MAKAKSAAKSGRRAKQKARAGRRRTAKAATRATQKFSVSHYREEDFRDGGLRSHAKYRDLGMSVATNGMVQAHVIRHVRPADHEGAAKRHYHDVQFQMVYVLKGWLKTAFDGQGEFTMREGSCWLQPPRIVHAVQEYSDDCELLEIILPADFKTVTLE